MDLEEIRKRFGGKNETKTYNDIFRHALEASENSPNVNNPPYMGIPTLLDAPIKDINWENPNFDGLDVALLGIPMDLGVSNRNGCRFGPRALRNIEAVGPYNHVLKISPFQCLNVADIGDIPFQTRFNLDVCHEDIAKTIAMIHEAGVMPLSVGGDHSMTLPILRALGHKKPLAMIHIDAHSDTGGIWENTRFHHGGPFRQAVLEGVLDPLKTIQIGIRGSSECIWEFSYETGMTVIHAEDIERKGIEFAIQKAQAVVGDSEVYLTFDIDALDPAFAPGTGTPEIGGLTTREAQVLLRGLAGINIIGGDVVEVAPAYDATTNTAHAGAQMLFEILSLMAVKHGRK